MHFRHLKNSGATIQSKLSTRFWSLSPFRQSREFSVPLFKRQSDQGSDCENSGRDCPKQAMHTVLVAFPFPPKQARLLIVGLLQGYGRPSFSTNAREFSAPLFKRQSDQGSDCENSGATIQSWTNTRLWSRLSSILCHWPIPYPMHPLVPRPRGISGAYVPRSIPH